jgi:RHS repeat-associated protein
VTINAQSTYRRGEYYQAALSFNNTSGPIYLSVTNKATLNPNTNTTAGNLYAPQTAEVYSHDADGNLTNDGRWMIFWDAENRPTRFESQTGAPGSSKRKVTLGYDYLGRISRRVEYDGSSGSYVLANDLKFVYDDWRCLVELNATNNSALRSYVWGVDLSGSLTGAGGVGGLLMLNSTANGVHFFGYDGNGNVIALVKASDGTASAFYEYDPFGQTIRATGLMANENPFRFSTKRKDDTTDIVHYEYRPYFASTGRWLSRDPLAVAEFDLLHRDRATKPDYDPSSRRFESRTATRISESEILYVFVRNMPIIAVDALGLREIDIINKFGKVQIFACPICEKVCVLERWRGFKYKRTPCDLPKGQNGNGKWVQTRENSGATVVDALTGQVLMLMGEYDVFPGCDVMGDGPNFVGVGEVRG